MRNRYPFSCNLGYHLADFARRYGVRVETVLPLHHGPVEQARAGYWHLTGDAKRDPALVARCEARLARDYPADYRAFLAGWKRIEREGGRIAAPATGGSLDSF